MAFLSYILPLFLVCLCLFDGSYGSQEGGVLENMVKSEDKKSVDMMKASMESQVEKEVKKRVKEEVEKELETIREGKCVSSFSLNKS